jgi:hypothetical protein
MSFLDRPARISFAVVALLVFALCHSGAQAELPLDSTPRFRVEVPLDRPAEQVPELRAVGLDVDYYDDKTGSVYMNVTETELGYLRQMGYEPTVLQDLTTTEDSIAALSDYTDETESDAAVTRVANDYPAIAKRFEYPYLTEEGRVVPYLKISDNVELDEPEPRILFVSQHHSNEVMTPEVMIDMMDLLTQNYGIDPEITEWIDNYAIYIIPCHNPDGTNYVFNVSSGWRKNRHDNGDGNFGVDLNRNYPYLWGPEGCNGSSGSTGSTTYRGPSAGSEMETQGIMEVAQGLRPSISLTYHTSGQYVLHPFGCPPNLPDDPDRRAHREIGSMMAAVIVNDAGNGYYRMGTPPELLYEVDGDSDGWLHAIAGTVGFTIEMNTSQQPDYDTWRDDTVLRNRDGWKWLLRRLGMGSVTGKIRDACTDAGMVAEVSIDEQVYAHGQEPRTSVPGHGFYHRVLPSGEYTWVAEASGYRRQEWPIAVRFEPLTRDIWLVPEGSHGLEARSLAVDDSGSDADGQLDPGEEADLLLTALASGDAVSGLSATLATTDPYVQILDGAATLPDLSAGEESAALDPFRVRVLEDAPDGHVATLTVTFAANETLCRAGGDVEARITIGLPSCPFEQESFDTDPGWTISGPGDGWEFGPPEGSGGNGGPAEARTGVNVYGTNLNGNYGTTAGEFVLTTTPFDLQGLRDAELRFWRWLNDEPGYDPVRIEVSIDQTNWVEVWRGFGRDTGWEQYRIELPPEVDDEDQVSIRFILEQDGGGSRSGLYIDDVEFCGESFLSAGGKLKYESHSVYESDPDYGNADGETDTNETVTMVVGVRSTRNAESRQVSAVLTTSDPEVVIHNDVGLYPDIPAGGLADTLSPYFTFTIGPDCADKIPFTLETRSESGPSTLSHFLVTVGTLQFETLFTDDMETDTGWTVSGSATAGAWERGQPWGNNFEGETTNPDVDHTPDPGYQCWNTQSVPPPITIDPYEAEVDGETILTSPVIAAGAFEDVEFNYWRWFYRGGGAGPDTYRVQATEDGVNFRTVDEIGSIANLWTEATHELSEAVAPTDLLQVRIVVTDSGGESIVEAGLDDVTFSGNRWVCDPFESPLLDPPNPVGDTLRVDKLGWDVKLTWQEPASDPSHGRATFYRLERSPQPDGGFSEIGTPTGTLHVDLGFAGPSSPGLHCYLVYAENSGGSE